MLKTQKPKRNKQKNNANTANRGFPLARNAHPPVYNADFRITHKFRYTNGGAYSGTVQSSDFAPLLFMSTGTTTGYSLIESFRIIKVEIWCATASASSPASINFAWASNSSGVLSGPGNSVSDTALGVSELAHIKTNPPPGSVQGAWQSSGASTSLFTMDLGADSIVDVTLEFTFNLFGNNFGIATSGSGMTAGLMYQHSIGAGALVPVGARYGGA
jgi:hypothetical protein